MEITIDASKIPEFNKQGDAPKFGPIQPRNRIDSNSDLWWVYFDETGKLIAAKRIERIRKDGDLNDVCS